MKRRDFLRTAGAATAAAAAPGWLSARPATDPLRILILGGTRFIGVHMTALALKHGHSVTFFNRGRTNPGLFPQVERITGDRNGDIDGLKGRQWDVVIDNSGYVPRQVRATAELLAPNVKQYLFVSSVSVYPNFSEARSESSPLARIDDETTEKVDGSTYGALKALCEKAAETAMPGRTTVLRPGLIVGPKDNTDRFTYWPARAARGGEFMAPGKLSHRIQIIDARDLAAFTLRMLEERRTGAFNVVSPPGLFTMGALIAESLRAARTLADPDPPPRAVWVDPNFLAEHKVGGLSDMPVWIAPRSGDAAFALTSAERAVKAGLTISPLRKTVLDTLAWHLERPDAERIKLKAGIEPAREREVLAAWRAVSNVARTA
jgi:2'-hydroxyisoflavone reductase